MRVKASEIISIMNSWVGLDRAKGTHKPIIDLYNSHTPLARNYKVKYTDAFCDTTVSAAFIKANAEDMLGGTECGCEEHIKMFKKAGIWEEDGTVTPTPGAIILYNWDQNYQPNDGHSDHIGIVERVDGKKITVIEGNIGGKVGRRTIDVGNGYIRGYAFPNYLPEETERTDKTITVELRVLRKGCKGTDVCSLQALLVGLGFDPNGIDGDFGSGTDGAVKKFQAEENLEVDGIVGKDTWTALLK